MTTEEYEELPAAEKEKIDTTGNDLKGRLADVLAAVRENEKGVREALASLDRIWVVLSRAPYRALKEKYAEYPKVIHYLESVQEDILLNLEEFKVASPAADNSGLKLPAPQAPLLSDIR